MAKLLVVSFFVVLMIQSAWAKTNCHKPLPEPLTAEILDTAKKDCQIKTTTNLRYILPKNFRSNFTFIRYSASAFAECIDPKRFSPRLIMFSPKSDLILAMPWNPEMVGNFNCNAFETMELKPQATKLTLTLHSLTPIPPAHSPLPKEIEPIMPCSSCHGGGGTSIWHEYDTWKGKGTEAYGSQDDLILKDSDEAREYSRFLEHITQDGTHSTLIWPENNDEQLSEVTHNISKEYSYSVDHSFLSLPPYQFFDKEIKGRNYNYRANVKLSFVINRLNTTKIYNIFTHHPLFEDLKLLMGLSAEFCFSGRTIRLPKRLSAPEIKIEESGLVGKPGNSAKADYIILPLNILKFTYFTGIPARDVLIDPRGEEIMRDAFVNGGYFDGQNTTFNLLTAMTMTHDHRFAPYLIKGYPFFGAESFATDNLPLQEESAEFCEKLADALPIFVNEGDISRHP